MEISAIERVFPTFTPWGRRLLASAGGARRAVVGAAGRAEAGRGPVLGAGPDDPRPRARRRAGMGRPRCPLPARRRGGRAAGGGDRLVRLAVEGRPGRPGLPLSRMWPTPERPRRHMMEAELKELSRLYAAPSAVRDGVAGGSRRGRLPRQRHPGLPEPAGHRRGGGRDRRASARLEILDLSSSSVTDAGLAHLDGLSGLESLYLSDTQVGDAGLAHLEGTLPPESRWTSATPG